MSIENGKQPAFPILTSEMGAFGSVGMSKFEYAAKDVLCAIVANEGAGHLRNIDRMDDQVARSIAYTKAFFEALALEESEVQHG